MQSYKIKHINSSLIAYPCQWPTITPLPTSGSKRLSQLKLISLKLHPDWLTLGTRNHLVNSFSIKIKIESILLTLLSRSTNTLQGILSISINFKNSTNIKKNLPNFKGLNLTGPYQVLSITMILMRPQPSKNTVQPLLNLTVPMLWRSNWNNYQNCTLRLQISMVLIQKYKLWKKT